MPSSPRIHARAIFSVLIFGPTEVLRCREAANVRWSIRAAQPDTQEKRLFKAAAEGVKACWSARPGLRTAPPGKWKGKSMLLFEEMAKAAGVDNAA